MTTYYVAPSYVVRKGATLCFREVSSSSSFSSSFSSVSSFFRWGLDGRYLSNRPADSHEIEVESCAQVRNIFWGR